MSSNNYWKKYFAIYLRDESGYRYSVDNDGFSDEDLRGNVGKVIEQMSEDR
ncbi:hypothetical protein [Paucisalibacillus sp. EB02]|uniref:hypothetical protein n=1 Tax=Paucisalibacillus sp. EB02 TaxID=1347087 RepID=UPI0012DE17A6|nr:hypothetical protein [Paucisalibacillus sp. EB02]